MNQLEYLPGIAGQSVQLDGPSAFVGIAEEMRSREWDYDLGYRDLVTATRPARTVDVTFHADYDTADILRRVADADVMARTPGTFVAQKEWKQRGYILASDVDDIHYGRLSTGLKIALLDGAWWRLVKRSFVPEITTPEYRSATGETVTASGASGAPLHVLTVDGKAVQDGTPTPISPVPVEVVSSKNLFDAPVQAYISSVSGAVTVNNTGGTSFVGKLEPNTDYVIKSYLYEGQDRFRVLLFDADPREQYGTAFTTGHYKSIVNTNGPTTDQEQSFNSETFTWVLLGTSTSSVAYNPDAQSQLEKGSTASPYVPHGCIGLDVNGTITPIDLQGNVLASLPDGTKDVLTVDSAGHCVLTKNVGKTTINDSLAFGSSFTDSGTMGGNCTRITMNMSNFPTMKSAALNATNSYMSIAVAGSTSASATPYPGFYSKTATSGVYLTLPSTLTSASDVAAWLTANNFDFFYQLAEATTIDLGTINMPAVPFEAQISVTAAVTPTITAEWQISRDAYLDYPHNYEYDFQATSSTGSITPSVLTPSDVYLAVFGPAVNPYVIVGGNRYQVNVTVPSGGYLVVDGRDKTINLTLADGTVQNVFSSGVRGGGSGGGSYIFERIPAGISEVTYDGSFGFDLGWYEEEGEPPWSQS